MKQLQVIANDMIPIYRDREQMMVNARELHEFLGSGQDFSTWIKARIEKYGFVENEDFSFHKIVEANPSGKGVQTRIEYLLKLDCAKEIAMVENNEQGRTVRRYFIEAEKKLRELAHPARNLPRNYLEALKELTFTVESNVQLQEECKIKDQLIGELKPKADYTDLILRSKGTVNITQIAKDYGMSGGEMNKLLHKLKIQYKNSRGQWLLYDPYYKRGYTHSDTIDFIHSDGRPDVRMHTNWTQKGRLFLYDKLKTHGMLPLIEQKSA